MVTDIKEENRLVLAQVIDNALSQTDEFSEDLVLTSDIQLLLEQYDCFLTLSEVNEILTIFKFKGDLVSGSAERLWYVKLK